MYKILNALSLSQLILVTSFFLCVQCDEKQKSDVNKTIHEKVIPLVRQWAPKVWLDPEEKFFPGNVSNFLKEIVPSKKDHKGAVGNATKIPIGNASKDLFFITIKNRDDLLKDVKSFLYGTNPTTKNVSVYAYVKSCDPNYSSFIVTYWFFYPFNEGKKMCTIDFLKRLPVFKLFNKCLGKSKVYGNHIADWERVSMEIKNGTPSSLFLSVHNVGVFYNYDKAANSFVLSRAKSKGLGEAQDPPETVQIDKQGHPVLFSAKGSHALWASVGSHKYTKLNVNELSDAVDYGTPWETWHSLKVFYSNETTPDWFKYEGHWGNPSTDCVTKDICAFSDGPGGLATRKADFNCTK